MMNGCIFKKEDPVFKKPLKAQTVIEVAAQLVERLLYFGAAVEVAQSKAKAHFPRHFVVEGNAVGKQKAI